MKYLKTFNESLESDFKDTIEDNQKDRILLSSFITLLSDKHKSEFEYRISDGEDSIKVMKDFLDRVDELEDKDDPLSKKSIIYHGRNYIISKELDEISDDQKKVMQDTIGLARFYDREGSEKFHEVIFDEAHGGIDTINYVIATLKMTRDQLQKNQDNHEWASGKHGVGINQSKIDSMDKILSELKEKGYDYP